MPPWLRQLGIPVLLVVSAGLGTWWLLRPSPKPSIEAPPAPKPLVQIQVVELGPQRQVVRGSGAVSAARNLVASMAVGGQVAWIHPLLEPGGLLEKGEVFLRLDAREFELAVAQRRSERVQAEAELARARGQNRAAQRSFERLRGDGSDLDPALARREPELRAAQARLAGAQAALERAELDLERTRLRVPFESLVLERTVEVRQQVTPAAPVARFAGAESFWIRVPIPLRDAAFVGDEAAGRRVEIERTMTPRSSTLDGRLLRLAGEVDQVGRLVDAIVAIDEPLQVDPPVKLGEFVDVRFSSDRKVQGARLPRGALRGGERVYVVDESDELVVRSVHVAWGDRGTVVVDEGLRTGDRVIVSRMGVALPGMSLEVAPPTPAPGTRG
ncbi:MAG: efflux RND transporter periplasmic adaptor subunit [Myxococcota bacterium]